MHGLALERSIRLLAGSTRLAVGQVGSSPHLLFWQHHTEQAPHNKSHCTTGLDTARGGEAMARWSDKQQAQVWALGPSLSLLNPLCWIASSSVPTAVGVLLGAAQSESGYTGNHSSSEQAPHQQTERAAADLPVVCHRPVGHRLGLALA